MKALICFIILLPGLFAVNGQQYKPVDDKSEVKFIIKNFGINTNGSLAGLKGTIKFDPQNLSSSSFNVSVDVNTVNTDVDSRDSHLKKEEYFNVEKYPAISFTSTNMSMEQGKYKVTGNLTIKGVTKTISFPFTVEKQDNGLIMNGEFSIDRKDFGVGGSSAVLSNTVNVDLKVYAVKV